MNLRAERRVAYFDPTVTQALELSVYAKCWDPWWVGDTNGDGKPVIGRRLIGRRLRQELLQTLIKAQQYPKSGKL